MVGGKGWEEVWLGKINLQIKCMTLWYSLPFRKQTVVHSEQFIYLQKAGLRSRIWLSGGSRCFYPVFQLSEQKNIQPLSENNIFSWLKFCWPHQWMSLVPFGPTLFVRYFIFGNNATIMLCSYLFLHLYPTVILRQDHWVCNCTFFQICVFLYLE